METIKTVRRVFLSGFTMETILLKSNMPQKYLKSIGFKSSHFWNEKVEISSVTKDEVCFKTD